MPRRQPQPGLIELDQLLHGELTTWDEVVTFWKHGDFHEEHYTVAAIKRHLRTEEQRRVMFEHDFSIEDILNGRIAGDVRQRAAEKIMEQWNAKLGYMAFNR